MSVTLHRPARDAEQLPQAQFNSPHLSVLFVPKESTSTGWGERPLLPLFAAPPPEVPLLPVEPEFPDVPEVAEVPLVPLEPEDVLVPELPELPEVPEEPEVPLLLA